MEVDVRVNVGSVPVGDTVSVGVLVGVGEREGVKVGVFVGQVPTLSVKRRRWVALKLALLQEY